MATLPTRVLARPINSVTLVVLHRHRHSALAAVSTSLAGLAHRKQTGHLVVNNKLMAPRNDSSLHTGPVKERCLDRAGDISALEKAIASLDRGRGHSPCFSSGDMVAASVIRALAIDLSVRVGALAPMAETLLSCATDHRGRFSNVLRLS
ncbi:hypothetical protein HGG75_17625 [Ochrobactrum pseudogrignonense]|nr:hypothetical protein [Brucella pseudogrignonensis]